MKRIRTYESRADFQQAVEAGAFDYVPMRVRQQHRDGCAGKPCTCDPKIGVTLLGERVGPRRAA